MATWEEAQQQLRDKILEEALSTTVALNLLRLAEALAWVEVPNQAHGGTVEMKS